MIPYEEGRMVPSSADAPTLTLACAVLLASVYPQGLTPDQALARGLDTVDVVFGMWNEIQRRIAAGSAP